MVSSVQFHNPPTTINPSHPGPGPSRTTGLTHTRTP
jgi:hypothetical protein